jgi:outer membrane receptor protein involved in Fe transport
MGGVINVMTTAPARRRVELKTQYGTLNSPQFDVVASDVWNRLGVVVSASAFDTEGYPTVVETERGVIDTKAAVDYQNLSVKLQYDASARIRAFLRAGYFQENRDNGKVSTFDTRKEENDTRWTSVSGGVNVKLPDLSELQASLFTDVETFHSNFLAVPPSSPARSVGRMTLLQTVPTTGVGGSVTWSRAFGAAHLVTAGSDLRWVKGESQELGLDTQTGANITLDRRSGGRQRSIGFFGQDLIALTPELSLTLSARLDSWKNYDGHNLETSLPSGVPTAGNRETLPDRSDTVVSPRGALSYRISEKVNVWGSFGAGFRAPTLNELYRQFRVGTTLTLANDQLGPERLKGGELGVRVTPASNVIWRATWFDNRVSDAVSNVTLSSTPALVTRQRQNLGLTRVAGIQTDVEYRPSSALSLSAAYVYNRATVKEAAANPALVGLTLPQVPRHRGSVEISYSDPKYVTLVVQVQGIGRQFDDDENIRVVPGMSEPGLPEYGLASLSVSRDLGRTLQVFANVQNLFDQEYFVGTLPTTVGSPRLFHAGVRIRWDGN